LTMMFLQIPNPRQNILAQEPLPAVRHPL
jgi:hypothetical protein